MTTHAVFIWSAYGATAVVIAALVVRAIVDHRAQVRTLARLQRDGVEQGATDG